jgi:hypothetical protein
MYGFDALALSSPPAPIGSPAQPIRATDEIKAPTKTMDNFWRIKIPQPLILEACAGEVEL